MIGAVRNPLVVLMCAVSLTACSKDEATSPSESEDQTPPFGGFMVMDGDDSDYIQIPHAAALNPTGAMTLEGWVRFDSFDCESLIGKDYREAYWVGVCDGALRSYVHGLGSARDAGTFAVGVWTHFAITSDGSVRNHYVNGQLISQFADPGPLTTSPAPVRIGSDVSWEQAPRAALDEFRLWNVARTQAQIQSTMNMAITTAMPGLVAVWPLNTDGRDAVGAHHGSIVGTPLFSQ